MRNQAMQRKLNSHKCVDISNCRRTTTGDYLLETFVENVDYCDAVQEAWVWSIGKTLAPLPSVMADGTRETLPAGTFLASLSDKFYSMGESKTIECVFLR